MGFWEQALPKDTRGWLTLGLFLLMIYIITLVAFVPRLDTSQLFTALASGIIGAGFGSAVGYYFATTKGASDNREMAKDIIALAKQAPILVEPEATAKVEVTEKE